MAYALKHKRYFSKTGDDSSNITFNNVEEAKTQIGLNLSVFTGVIGYALANSNQSLVVTFDFDNIEASNNMQAAVATALNANNAWTGTNVTNHKIEWLDANGDVRISTDLV